MSAAEQADFRRGELTPAVHRALLACAAQGSNWPLTITDAEGNILAANDAAPRVLGYSRTEFEQLHILDVCPLSRTTRVSEVMDELARTGSVTGIGVALHRDGSEVIVRYSATKLETSQRTFYIFSSLPIRRIDTAASPQARGGAAPRQRTITDREREILSLVGEGYENDEIARRLHLSVNTVKTYMQRALGKLGAQSRAHAVALALRRGLID